MISYAVKINSLYTLLINRFRIYEKIQPRSGVTALLAAGCPNDRSELSWLVAVSGGGTLENYLEPVQTARLSHS